MKLFLPALACVILLFSCSKKSDSVTTPPPPPSIPDTLTTGWASYPAPANFLADIFFVDALNGYAVKDSGIYRSADGGINWSKLSFSGNAGGINIGAGAANKACFVGIDGFIYSTQNGTTLQSFAVGAGVSANDCFFSSANTCYVSTIGSILKSVDGGVTFSNIYNFSNSSYVENPIFFINDQTGWVLRNDYLYKTTNGGVTWSTTGQPYGQPCKVAFLDVNNGYYSTSAGVNKTTDGGATWKSVYTFPSGNGYNDISFINTTTGYLSDGRHIYKTVDGGTSWTMVLEAGGGIVEVQFIDANHGWACGLGGKIFIFKQ